MSTLVLAHRVADRLGPVGRVLADADLLDNARRLADHSLLVDLFHLDRTILECVDPKFADRNGTIDRAPIDGDGLVAESDVFGDGILDHVGVKAHPYRG